MKKIDFTTSDIDFRKRPCDKKQCFFTLKTEKKINEVYVHINKNDGLTLFLDNKSSNLRFIFYGVEYRFYIMFVTKQSILKFKGLHDGELILSFISDDSILYVIIPLRIIPLRVEESRNRSFVTEVLEDTVNKFQEQQRVVLYDPVSLSDIIPDSPFFTGDASLKMSTNAKLIIMDFDNNGYMSISDTAYKKLEQLDTSSSHTLTDIIKETIITGYVTPPRRITMQNYIERLGGGDLEISPKSLKIATFIFIPIVILTVIFAHKFQKNA